MEILADCGAVGMERNAIIALVRRPSTRIYTVSVNYDIATR